MEPIFIKLFDTDYTVCMPIGTRPAVPNSSEATVPNRFSLTLDDQGPLTGTAVHVFQGLLDRAEPESGRPQRECGRTQLADNLTVGPRNRGRHRHLNLLKFRTASADGSRHDPAVFKKPRGTRPRSIMGWPGWP